MTKVGFRSRVGKKLGNIKNDITKTNVGKPTKKKVRGSFDAQNKNGSRNSPMGAGALGVESIHRNALVLDKNFSEETLKRVAASSIASETSTVRFERNVNEKFDKGNRQAEKGKFEKAKESYREALNFASDGKVESEIYLAIANVSLTQKNDESIPEKERTQFGIEVVSNFEKAIALMEENGDEDLPNVKAKFGTIFYNLDDFEGALEVYSDVVKDTSGIERSVLGQMMYNMGMIKYRKKDYIGAQSNFDDVFQLKESDDDPLSHIPYNDVFYYLGISSFYSKDYDVVIKMLPIFLKECGKVTHASDKYDVGQVHLFLAKVYEKGEHENIDRALDHYLSYLNFKDKKLLIRLQSTNYIQYDVDTDMAKVCASCGHLSFETEEFNFAGNCLREAYFSMKKLPEKDILMLFRLAEKAHDSFTKTDNGKNRMLMLKEIISMWEGLNDHRSIFFYFMNEKQKKELISDNKIAEYYEYLGKLYKQYSEHHSAMESLSKCLQLRKQFLGPEDKMVGKLQCTLGSFFYHEGEYDKALHICKHAAYDSVDTGIRRKALCIVGKIYAKRLDHPGCVEAFEEALRLAKSSGENSKDVSITYELFGQANFHLGLFEASIDCFHNAFQIRTMIKEGTRDDCIDLIRCMVDGYKKMKKYKLALMACSKILSAQKEILHPFSVEIASTKEIMGDLHANIGGKNDFLNAVELYRVSAQIFREQGNPSNENLLRIYIKMANILGLKLNEASKALKIFRIVIKSYEMNEEGVKPIEALKAHEGVADVQFHKGDYSSALHYYKRILSYIEKTEQKETVLYKMREMLYDLKVDMFYKIGLVHMETDEFDIALVYLGRGLLNISEKNTEGDIKTSLFLYKMGLIHKELDDNDTALKKFSEANEVLELISDIDSKGLRLHQDVEQQIRETKRMALSRFLCK